MSKITYLTERNDMLTISEFLSSYFCDHLIQTCEHKGFGESTVNTPVGTLVNKNMRDNERIISDDVSLASNLWIKLEAFAPIKEGYKAVGLNERFRFYKYGPNQFFDWHFDASYKRSHVEASVLTFMVYLNDDYTGGTTDFSFSAGVFREDDPIITVKPEKGMALIFNHNILHRGDSVISGCKYVMRSDIIYRMD